MRAEYSKGLISIDCNGTDKNDAAKAKFIINFMVEELGSYEVAFVEDEGTKWESWTLCNNANLTIREMKEDYRAAKEALKNQVQKNLDKLTVNLEVVEEQEDKEMEIQNYVDGSRKPVVKTDSSVRLITGTHYYFEVYFNLEDKSKAEAIRDYLTERCGYKCSAENLYKESGLFSFQYENSDMFYHRANFNKASEDFLKAVDYIERSKKAVDSLKEEREPEVKKKVKQPSSFVMQFSGIGDFNKQNRVNFRKNEEKVRIRKVGDEEWTVRVKTNGFKNKTLDVIKNEVGAYTLSGIDYKVYKNAFYALNIYSLHWANRIKSELLKVIERMESK